MTLADPAILLAELEALRKREASLRAEVGRLNEEMTALREEMRARRAKAPELTFPRWEPLP